MVRVEGSPPSSWRLSLSDDVSDWFAQEACEKAKVSQPQPARHLRTGLPGRLPSLPFFCLGANTTSIRSSFLSASRAPSSPWNSDLYRAAPDWVLLEPPWGPVGGGSGAGEGGGWGLERVAGGGWRG